MTDDKITPEAPDLFGLGLFCGSLIGFAAVFIIDRTTDNHADYWRGAFCLEAADPPNFCAGVPDYQFYLDTMSRFDEAMQEPKP
jgi:hypothetical protein